MKGIAFVWTMGLLLIALVSPKASGQASAIFEPVRLTAEQVALLKTAATEINDRTAFANIKLKEIESQREITRIRTALFSTLFDEQKQVQKIQEKFESLSRTEEARRASKVFFGDILDLYSAGGKNVKVFPANEYLIVRNNTFQIFNHTHTAYRVAAQRGALTFDLEVRSTPPEATVSLRRKGDTYATHPRVTNTTIKNLVYATWEVRAELKGHLPQEKIYDPFRDPSNVLEFALQRK
jgi:hypothetical protein